MQQNWETILDLNTGTVWQLDTGMNVENRKLVRDTKSDGGGGHGLGTGKHFSERSDFSEGSGF